MDRKRASASRPPGEEGQCKLPSNSKELGFPEVMKEASTVSAELAQGTGQGEVQNKNTVVDH